MLSQVELVMFAIQAAINLGRKIQTVFEDETRDRGLILPPVEGDDLPFWDVTEAFFKGEGQVFVQPLGLYYNFWEKRNEANVNRDKLREAHLRIIKGIETHRSADDVQGAFRWPEQFYSGANALFVVKQWREDTDPKRHPVQRIGGTVVEIALDYVKADPTLFGGNGKGDRITRAFLLSLDEVEFAEAKFDDLLLDVLQASLETIRIHADLVISEDHFALLLRQISTTLTDGIKKAQDSGDDDKLRALYTFRRKLLQQIVKVSAQTAAEHAECFFGTSDTREEKIIACVLKAILDTITKESDLFTSRALADIYAAGLRALGQNAALIVPNIDGKGREAFLTNLFAGVAGQLASSAAKEPPGLFSPEVLKDVIEAALDILAVNVTQLIDSDNPEKQLLVDALERVILSLSDDFHKEKKMSVILKGFFSRPQLVEIIQEIFEAVARNPDSLLQGVNGDAKRSALAQIIGSIAATISTKAKQLLNGEDYLDLLTVALRAFAKNPDRLLNLDTNDPMENVMAQVIEAIIQASVKNLEGGGRNLLNGEILVELIEVALTVVSKNVNGFLQEPEIVAMVMDRLMNAASNVLANELDAENLMLVFPAILREALRDRSVLDVSDADLVLPILTAGA